MSILSLPIVENGRDGKDGQDIASTDVTLLRRLGIESLPMHETLTIAVEKLIVSETDLIMRSAKRLVKSIARVGILQNPSVVVRDNLASRDEQATFEVIAGRRRVLAARLAGLPVVKCEAYASSTLPLSAFLMLIENEQRSAAWVQEVEALRRLLDEKVGMTVDDLAAFGFDRMHLHERLKIAQLPTPLLERILAGKVNREVARKLTRLTVDLQERVAQLADTGEEITSEQVKGVLRAQINAGLVPLQARLTQGWSETQPEAYAAPPMEQASIESEGEVQASQSIQESDAVMPVKPLAVPAVSLQEVFDVLCAFAQSSDYQTVPRAVQTLTQALAQQLLLTLRSMAPLPHADIHKQQEKPYEKGEFDHV
jgi:ParB/RepB/Spo0J family partition protein